MEIATPESSLPNDLGTNPGVAVKLIARREARPGRRKLRQRQPSNYSKVK